MATYYKYAERNVDSQINWAEVGRGISDMLSNEAEIREEKKAAIDEASRQFAEVLANAPQGEYQPMNDWLLKFGDDAAQMRLMQDTLLKSGQLKLRDYTAMRQNITDGVNDMFTVAEKIQKDAELKMQRYKDGESQELEAWLMEQVQGLANFQKSQGYINPATGQVSLGKMVEGPDGVMVLSTDPADLMSIQEMKNYISTEFDYYDSDAALRENVAEIGNFVTNNIDKLKGFLRTGSITEITDATLRDDFESIINLQIEAMMDNPYNLTSILSNDMRSVTTKDENGNIIPTGKTWEFEWYKEGKEYDDNVIVMKDDGSGMPKPMITEFQEEKIREYLKTKEIGMISKEMETRTFQSAAPNAALIARGDRIRANQDAAGKWNQLFYGNADEKDAAAQTLLSHPTAIQNGLIAIETNEAGKISLIYNDKSLNRTIDFTKMSPDDWAATGAEIHGVTDVQKAVNAGGGFRSRTPVLETGAGARRTGGSTGEGISPQRFQKLMMNKYAGVSESSIRLAGPDNLSGSIKRRLGEFGFKATVNKDKKVIATGPSGNEYEISTGKDAKGDIDAMIKNESTNPEGYVQLTQAGKSQGSSNAAP